MLTTSRRDKFETKEFSPWNCFAGFGKLDHNSSLFFYGSLQPIRLAHSCVDEQADPTNMSLDHRPPAWPVDGQGCRVHACHL